MQAGDEDLLIAQTIALERRAIGDGMQWSTRGPVHPLVAARSAQMDADRPFWDQLRRVWGEGYLDRWVGPNQRHTAVARIDGVASDRPC